MIENCHKKPEWQCWQRWGRESRSYSSPPPAACLSRSVGEGCRTVNWICNHNWLCFQWYWGEFWGSSPAIVGPSIQGQCSAESQIFPQPWIRLLSIITWGWWPPHWWREPSWCQRWQRFSHHLQPPEVAVVCPIKRQDVALLFLLVSCKDSPSSTALDWHEQSDKKFRRFGRRNQLSDRTCPQIISAFGKHYWNWSFTAVTICDFDVRNKPYCRVYLASPSFHVNTKTRSASELVLCTTCSFIVVINVIVLDC